VEFKFQEAPKVTPSMKSAVKELNLAHLWIIYPGKNSFALEKNISAIGLNSLVTNPDIEMLRK
jgi:hypothetical protein